MAIPKLLQSCFPSYNLSRLEIKGDKRLIITQILNRGDDVALEWLGKTYSQKEIKEIVSSPNRGMWLKSILLYWQRIFNTKLPKQIFKEALIDLNP